eukprot:3953518-Pyramimonas_sp.AAC.1
MQLAVLPARTRSMILVEAMNSGMRIVGCRSDEEASDDDKNDEEYEGSQRWGEQREGGGGGRRSRGGGGGGGEVWRRWLGRHGIVWHDT